ncbi:MAG: class I SAM-dependent methyltransferase [Bdellovibrionales bacterium]|nr:class I SAM-dependent methyltransferase [Bdellovibrionales bacterium]
MSGTEKFSDRAAEYARARPSYPAALLDYLKAQASLGPGAVVADIGAGTGIFTRLLAEQGARVWAVEPNQEMRSYAAETLPLYPSAKVVAGSAEATGLDRWNSMSRTGVLEQASEELCQRFGGATLQKIIQNSETESVRINKLFGKNSQVSLRYDTELYLGHLEN